MIPSFADVDDSPRAPEEGSDEWLWFKPSGQGYISPDKKLQATVVSISTTSSLSCSNCDTRGVKDPWAKKMQCWCCGRFMKLPTPIAYTKSPSAYTGWRY